MLEKKKYLKIPRLHEISIHYLSLLHSRKSNGTFTRDSSWIFLLENEIGNFKKEIVTYCFFFLIIFLQQLTRKLINIPLERVNVK